MISSEERFPFIHRDMILECVDTGGRHEENNKLLPFSATFICGALTVSVDESSLRTLLIDLPRGEVEEGMTKNGEQRKVFLCLFSCTGEHSVHFEISWLIQKYTAKQKHNISSKYEYMILYLICQCVCQADNIRLRGIQFQALQYLKSDIVPH